MKNGKNCHEYCRYSKLCTNPGEIKLDPEDCPVAWNYEDLRIEAKYEPDDEDAQVYEEF